MKKSIIGVGDKLPKAQSLHAVVQWMGFRNTYGKVQYVLLPLSDVFFLNFQKHTKLWKFIVL